MEEKIDRIGETSYNNFDSEMIITEYRGCMDIDVYFPEYDWIAKNRTYNAFKKGNIKCPYEPTVFGVGYLGEGKFKTRENGKKTRIYQTWYQPTYIDCKVSDEYHNLQDFGFWDSENYYQVEGEKMNLDKDILFKGNKIYSPETCMYVPQTINLLFVKNDKNRGKSVIGTTPKNDKYEVQCSLINPETGKSKKEYLGLYETQEKAFEVYKYHKEKNIKMVADYFKKEIPSELYLTLYNYIVEVTD